MFFAGSTNGMFMPERIDHHGWQLALLALSIAGDGRSRSGCAAALTLGIATALSLAIGLEMMIYLALAGAAMVLFWVADADGARAAARPMRSRSAAATALGFLVFASYDNRHRGLRRLVAGLAVRCAARRRADVRPRAGCRRRTGSSGWRWPSLRALIDRRLPRADLAALPAAARRRFARSRAAVAEPRARKRGRSIATAGGSRR